MTISLPLSSNFKTIGPGRLQTADKFHRHRNFRIVENDVQIVDQQARRKGEVSLPLHIGIDHISQFDRPPGMSDDALFLFQKQFCHPGTDGSQSDNRNFGWFHKFRALNER